MPLIFSVLFLIVLKSAEKLEPYIIRLNFRATFHLRNIARKSMIIILVCKKKYNNLLSKQYYDKYNMVRIGYLKVKGIEQKLPVNKG